MDAVSAQTFPFSSAFIAQIYCAFIVCIYCLLCVNRRESSTCVVKKPLSLLNKNWHTNAYVFAHTSLKPFRVLAFFANSLHVHCLFFGCLDHILRDDVKHTADYRRAIFMHDDIIVLRIQ